MKAWADTDMQVVAYVATKAGMPVRRLPMLSDFHMVGSSYNSKDPWQSLFIPKKSDGSKANKDGGTLTYRYYLQDMAFAVVMKAPEDMIDEVSSALKSPVWDLYLGRKSCAPTEFIFQGVFDSEAEAFQTGKEFASTKKRAASFEVRQGEHEGEVLRINDIPIQFGEQKQYRDRLVTVIEAR